MNNERKKELKEIYKNRQITGGVYIIRCNGNQRVWLRSTCDMDSTKSRFDFSMAIKSAPEPVMRAECEQYGAESFSLTVLDEIKKKDDSTNAEFEADVKLLFEMWKEKADNGEI